MSILNLALYGVALERPMIDREFYLGMEERFVSCKTTSDLRATGKRFPEFVEGLNDALTPMYDLLYERFEQLDLKGQPIRRGKKVSCEEADEFFNAIKVCAHVCIAGISNHWPSLTKPISIPLPCIGVLAA